MILNQAILIFLMMTIPLLYIRLVDGKNLKKIIQELIPVQKSWKKELLGAGKLLLLMFALSLVLGLATNLIGINDLQKVGEITNSNLNEVGSWFIFLVMISVIAEEIFFRGFLAQKLGAFGSSIIFGGMHYGYGSITELIGAFALGWLIAWWFLKEKSLTQPIIAHILYNSIAIISYGLIGA
jgi:membrane protease YdiL (CAAX protease family)